MKPLTLVLFLFLFFTAAAQTGVLNGNVLDVKRKALEGASVQLISLNKSSGTKSATTDKNGEFSIAEISFGYYRLSVTYVGLAPLTLDSIYFRKERYDFNLNDLELKVPSDDQNLNEVIIYAEKPLVESKDGNITFNAGESALSAGSSASDLLANVPLVSKDPSGNIMVRGKTPRILIDDKPVNLSLEQLQDLLESMPGSSIEKIEVLTNPPPQYANEQGGVINIVTKKGKVGMGARVTVYGGSRGEGGTNGNFNYRKQGLVININAGAGYSVYRSNGYSVRENTYRDSVNHLKTENNYKSQSLRPNLRAQVDYELNKQHAFNVVLQYNQNSFDNSSLTQYRNINRFDALYKLSHRTNATAGSNFNPDISFTYTHRPKDKHGVFRLFTNVNYSLNENDKIFYQQYFHPDYAPWYDSTQQQVNGNQTTGYNVRASYDLPLKNKKTSFSLGSFYANSRSNLLVDAASKSRYDDSFRPLDSLSNNFRYVQQIKNIRGSFKHSFTPGISFTAGANVEATGISFDLYRTDSSTLNQYWNFLPFFNFNRNWQNNTTLTVSYRRTVRRPGIHEQNPSIDFSDAYNIRMGNPDLKASPAHNLDAVLGRTKKDFYANLGIGYNIVEDIYSQIRMLQADEKTKITWQNISGRKEYEVSTWSGYTMAQKIRMNLSATYTYNTYSEFDKKERRFRNGGSLTSSINSSYSWKDLYSATGSFAYNRFANPQGTVKSSMSMRIGLQAKTMQKRMTVALNAIDPFRQQQYRTVTYGNNFTLESFSAAQSRNYRLSVSYNLIRPKKPVKTINKNQLNNMLKKS